MKKAWKTILIIALCVLIVGEIVLGVGLATGGSPDRIWEAAYEHYDIGAIFALIKSSGIADLLASIGRRGHGDRDALIRDIDHTLGKILGQQEIFDLRLGHGVACHGRDGAHGAVDRRLRSALGRRG